ncbi:pimeloyl-CoA dehydrogenase small subunit [Mesorhizobium sp. CGMCC 1.15528]|uniref:Pimeloyl-CoA dehydrogenase small subunit n=1 Tax=Mesorhizobium zhangyense TaxID=1776730 RepID=A0A7C9RB90_9HYPH|nr:acyl-CoA dehydrogenase family protein [Mesorhizobium zhangyense]NGN44556.1 pimeloyl-CoA dehydrogenase small subunit [Mesorhizobium zhangyense]
MDFDFTVEQQMLRDTLSSYLAEHWDFAGRRREFRDIAPGATALWRGIASDLGLFGAAFPTEAGGLGGGAVETMLIMEQFGRALVTEPYLSTAVIAGSVLKRWGSEKALGLIAEVISGQTIIALAHDEQSTRFRLANVRTRAVRRGDGYCVSGRKSVVLGGPVATHFLVTAETERGLTLLRIPASAAGVSREDFVAIDGQRASNIDFDNASALSLVGSEGEGLALLEPAIDDAIVALGAESIGIMRELIDRTTTYLQQRKQFGQPLASFQVLQHRLADMAIHFEQALSMVYMATLALQDDGDRPAAVSAMKIQADKSLRFVSQQAVQLHGGMGITDELAIGHYFKRALVIMASFGNEDDHYRRYDALMLKRGTDKAAA